MINKRIKNMVVEFMPVSNRIYKIRFSDKYRKVTIINVRCPNEDKNEEQKERFYVEIDRIYDQICDVKIIIDDFNAKLGREEIYKLPIGVHS